MRKITGIVLVIIVIVFLVPWSMGIITERLYQKIIKEYNTQGNVLLQLEHYHRGWFHSQAMLNITLTHPGIINAIKQVSILQPHLVINLNQTIQHGPIFYGRNRDIDSFFGLAIVRNKIHFSSELQKLLQTNDAQNALINDTVLLTLAGSCIHRFKVAPLEYIYVKNGLKTQIKQDIQGVIKTSLQGNNIIGEIQLPGLTLVQPEDYNVNVAQAKIKFNQHRTKSHLWMGTVDLFVSKFILQDKTKNSVQLSNVRFKGENKELFSRIQGAYSLEIEKINVNNDLLGPISLAWKAIDLNANAIVEMVEAYHQIMQRGELYASQLKFKLLSMAPNVLLKNSKIAIESLQLSAPEGNLQFKIELYWPYGEANASDLTAVFQDANINGFIQISKPLARRLIDYVFHMPFLRTISREQQRKVMTLADQVDLANQRNYLFMVMLVDNKQLPEASAIGLLEQQKEDVDLKEYSRLIKELFLEGKITRYSSYMLFWQYLDVKQHMLLFKSTLDTDKQSLKVEVNNQFNDWVKAGYIKQDSKDYTAVIHKENGIFKMNGKEVRGL